MSIRPLPIISDKDPWYANGLSFKCTECGQCCTGAPGYTWVTEEEIADIADYLNIPIKEFTKKFVRTVGDRYSLNERAVTYDCVFLKDRRCTIYPVRPKQCRTFPWWPRNLKSPESWAEAASRCEGINRNAPVVPIEEIEAQLKKHLQDS